MRTYLKYAVIAVTSLIALFTVSTTLHSWFYYQWPGIYADAWDYVELLEKYYQGSSTWADWFYPHALIHRLAIPRIIFLAEFEFFGAQNFLSNSISLLAQLAALGLLSLALYKKATLSTIEKIALTCFFIVSLFHAGQLYNLTDPTQNQLFLAMLFVLLATYFYHVHFFGTGKSASLFGLFAIAVLFACATFCNFFGFIAWAVFVAFLLLRKASLPARLVIIGFFVVIALFYFPIQQIDVKGIAGVPGEKVSMANLIPPGISYRALACQIVNYLGLFFSYPLSTEYGWLTVLIGCAVFVFSLVLALRAFLGDRTPVFFCYLFLFTLIVNSSIVLSRFVFSDPRALRFDFYQLWFIIGFISVLFFEARKYRWSQCSAWIFIALVTALLAQRQLPKLEEHYQRYIKVTKANLAYYVGSDTAYKTNIVNIFEMKTKVNVLARFREFLRSHAAGPYHEYADFDWEQSPPDEQGITSCQLKRMQVMHWDNQVVELRGVLLEKPERVEGASWVVFNAHNRASGLGVVFADQKKNKLQQQRWVVFFRAEADVRPITLWLKSGDASYLCRVEVNLQNIEVIANN